MIQVIAGDKGTGKTKRLIDYVNDSLKNEHGDIVFIDDDKRYMYDLRHEIRFVDASEYTGGKKSTANEMIRFIGGILAVNYDIALIAMDSFTKLVSSPLDSEETKDFFDKLNALSEAHHCNFLISISVPAETMPECVAKYVI